MASWVVSVSLLFLLLLVAVGKAQEENPSRPRIHLFADIRESQNLAMLSQCVEVVVESVNGPSAGSSWAPVMLVHLPMALVAEVQLPPDCRVVGVTKDMVFNEWMRERAKALQRDEYVLHLSDVNGTAYLRHAVNCLCGTVHQTRRLLVDFLTSENIQLAAPKHTVVYNNDMFSVMNDQYRLRTFTSVRVEGASYWVKARKGRWERRFIVHEEQARLIPHGLLIPTLIHATGGSLLEVIPALKPVAIYFPQYHPTPENDAFWGINFTEWTLLRNATFPGVMKPLGREDGGLGYYDLRDRQVRAKQGKIAKQAGFHAFMIYHYWFSGQQVPEEHKVLYKIPELLLQDGEPHLPFFFSWANEPWSRRWTGENRDVLLPQDYGDSKEWEEHFMYLLPFFQHPNYFRIDGKPVFVLYRVGHIGIITKPMLMLWNELARTRGFPNGLHFVDTASNMHCTDFTYRFLRTIPEIEASFHFWPHIYFLHPFFPRVNCSTSDVVNLPTKIQYWGSSTNFDNRVRRPNNRPSIEQSPADFGRNLRISFEHLSRKKFVIGQENLYFINAWNEWNEQATLEPSDRYGYQYLQQLKDAMSAMQLYDVHSRHMVLASVACPQYMD